MKNEILKYLNHKLSVEYFDVLPSTNAYIKAKAACDEGLLVIAERQTAGHGRFDRKFHSPKNGIYMSLLLKPTFIGFDTTLITTAAAVAVAQAIEQLSGKKSKIKWVNDVYIENKKVCGILTEGAVNPKTQGFDYVILGIGINAFTPENGFNSEIENIAGSVFEGFSTQLMARLTAQVINNFFEFYIKKKEFLTDYRSRSNVLGKEIYVLRNDTKVKATALEIDDKCRLLVKYENGNTEYLNSGEISIKIE